MNFGAGNFRGRRPGTSALRMLLRLTAVNPRGGAPSGQHQESWPLERSRYNLVPRAFPLEIETCGNEVAQDSNLELQSNPFTNMDY